MPRARAVPAQVFCLSSEARHTASVGKDWFSRDKLSVFAAPGFGAVVLCGQDKVKTKSKKVHTRSFRVEIHKDHVSRFVNAVLKAGEELK